MIIDRNARIITCPKCKTKKTILNLTSGNTCGASRWSDSKMIAPMLPQISPIQKCKECGNYFFLSDQKEYEKSSTEEHCSDLGTLSFDNCVDAMTQFSKEVISRDNHIQMLILTVFSFNDKYFRSIYGRIKPINGLSFQRDLSVFERSVSMLLNMLENDSDRLIFRAELMREIGLFDKASELLIAYKPSNDYDQLVVGMILDHIRMKDTKVFEIIKPITSDKCQNSKANLQIKTFTKQDYETAGKPAIFTIPDGFTHIADSAFMCCEALIQINIPDSVISIGARVFYNCINLISISIPNSVNNIGAQAFLGCSKLCEFDVEGDNFISKEGVIYNKSQSQVIASLPALISSRITLPDSVTSINMSAFANCVNLTSIIVPNSVRFISTEAFAHCVNLAYIEIPKSVALIGAGVFADCQNLKTILIEGDKFIVENGVIYNKRKTTLVSALPALLQGNLVVPNTVTSIPWGAFRCCKNLTSVVLPESVTTIRNFAFKNCYNLASIIAPNSLKEIGEDVFAGCNKLKIYISADNPVFNQLKNEYRDKVTEIRVTFAKF